MDFDFSDEQEQLRDAVRKWVDKGYGFERRRAISRDGGFSAQAFGELAALGLCGLYVSEDHGGMGMGAIEAMIAMEELGRGLVLEPVAQALITGAMLQAYAPADVAAAWLPGIADGSLRVALAYQERAARYDLTRCATQARAQGAGWVLSGAKSIVPYGDTADALLVPARLDDGIGLFLVRKGATGMSTRGYPTLDGGRAAELTLDGAEATLLSRDGQQALEHGVDIGIACLCAEAVGVMDRTLAITAEYMNTRKQFGVPISSFQALRHRAADMKMQLELARSMSYYASLKLHLPAAERRAAIARAKVQLGQSMRFIGQQAIQLHGGIGVTDEYVVGHYVKRLTQMEMSFGDTLHHLGTVSATLQDTAGVFA
ncbi:MAG: acyl-CoA dehydrogenase family protein [Rhodoferax sp.]|jgi:alkylation response protein AidB-like acyl-CoA dehydrogenase|nr:acyl-CoA dehydrogenase family protein [Rhodoferax sp.]